MCWPPSSTPAVFPATHYATDHSHMEENIAVIEHDLQERVAPV